MNVETAKSFFLWCTIINYTILLIWFLVFASVHDGHYRLTSRFFRVSVEQPHHKAGIVRATKAEAEGNEEVFDGATTEHLPD